MNIDSVSNGIVIDHIQAGNGLRIYRYLGLDALDCSVAIIKNCKSRKMGRKDIIKIDENISVDLQILGFLDSSATVNIVKDGQIIEKKKLSLPDRIVNVRQCNNPRCITTTEPGLDQVFRLCDAGSKLYRCVYCDSAMAGAERG